MKLPLFDLNDWFASTEGKFDLSLSHSACESQTIGDILSPDEVQAFRDTSLAYGPFDGHPQLQKVIAGQYQSVSPDEVMTFNGPSEVIYTFMRAMLKPGDQVVAQWPLFHSLHTIAREIGCEVRQWHPADELSCNFDVSKLELLCHQSTKLIIINFPHNPTGQMLQESELQKIADIAQSVNAMVFSDEVFRLLELPPQPTLPAMCDLLVDGISISGVSKPLGLGGLRLGWMATRNPEIRQAIKEYRYYTAEMTNTPCQLLATAALKRKDKILERNRAIIQNNLQRLQSFVSAHNDILQLYPPKAGTMAVVQQRTQLSSSELCKRLIEEERVFLVPGKPLGMSDQLIRFGLGRNDFEQGLKRLDHFLSHSPSVLPGAN